MINYIMHVYIFILIKSKPVFYDPEHMKINIHFKPICATTQKMFILSTSWSSPSSSSSYVVIIAVVLRGCILESIINRLVGLCINMEWVCTNYIMHQSCKSNTFKQLSNTSYRLQLSFKLCTISFTPTNCYHKSNFQTFFR